MTLRRIVSVISNPPMAKAYAKWLSRKALGRKPPAIQITDGVSIAEWISFSEYWSFQNCVPEREQFLLRTCAVAKDPTNIMIDIGANIGAFTCLMASLGAEVHAFEPIPETFCRLTANVTNNGHRDKTQLNCFAVGSNYGFVNFKIDKKDPAQNRITKSKNVGTHPIFTISLDEYCKMQGIEFISLLKVDVEGMEPYVLQGAKKLLDEKRISKILIEICPINLKSAGFSAGDLFREIIVSGYFPYQLTENGTARETLTQRDIEQFSLENIVLLPNALN